MDCSRRDLLKGLMKPEFWTSASRKPVLPDGVDILLDKDTCIAWGKGICTRCEEVCDSVRGRTRTGLAVRRWSSMPMCHIVLKTLMGLSASCILRKPRAVFAIFWVFIERKVT